jgi:hypothetical protein
MNSTSMRPLRGHCDRTVYVRITGRTSSGSAW